MVMRSNVLKIGLTGLCLVVAWGAAGCGDDTDGRSPVTIRFEAVVDGRPVVCGAPVGPIGSSAATVELEDLRFFVSAVRVIDRNGDEHAVHLDRDAWQADGVALIDLEDGTGACTNGNATLHDAVTGTTVADEVVGLRFEVGVPFEVNHQSPALADGPLASTAMHWGWQAGYKFMRLELDNGQGGWRVHLGSTGCEGAAPAITHCARPNRAAVALDGFDPATNTVVLDLSAWLAHSDVTANTVNTPLGCMGDLDDPDCGPVFAYFGLDLTSGAAEDGGLAFRSR